MEKNNDLIVNLPSTTLINDNIKKSNPIYEHYIPYFVYRRTDLKEGDKFEIVNDVSVELEFAKLNQYGFRSLCSKDHITKLIDYIISKRKSLDPDEELKTPEMVSYFNRSHITMAWSILKKYIRFIFLEKIHVYVDKQDIMNKNIIHYITKKDLIRFIKISFNFNYDKEIAEIYMRFIWLYNKEEDNSNIYLNIDNEIIERMVVYSLIGSHKYDYDEKYIQCVCERFPELICSLASNYNNLEAGMIDLSYIIDSKYFIPEILNILRNGYDITTAGVDQYNRFITTNNFDTFIHKCFNYIKTDEEKNEFKKLLCGQKFFKNFLPKKEYLSECEFADYGTYLICNYSEIQYIDPELINDNNLDFVSCISYGLELYIKSLYNHNYNEKEKLFNFVYYNLERFIEIIEKKIETESLESIPEMRIINTMMTYPITEISINKFIEKLWEYDFMKKYIFDLIPEYNKFVENNPGWKMSHYIISNDKLDEMYDKNVTAYELFKNVNIYFQLDWVKANYGILFPKLPVEIFNTKYNRLLPKEDIEWILNALSNEEKKTYPISLENMKAYPDLFKPYLSKYNIDRYIAAYGLNYVEKNIEINLTAIVNAEAYVNEQLVYRYLDIILLDEKLRTSALDNAEVCEIIAGNPKSKYKFYNKEFRENNVILNQILNSDIFDNIIKCSVMLAILRKNLYCEVILKRYKDYLVGSSYVGLALAELINIHYPQYAEIGICNSNIYFVNEK